MRVIPAIAMLSLCVLAQGTRGRIPSRTDVFSQLAWFERHQSKDGRWDSDGFFKRGNPERGPLCTGAGNPDRDISATGWALLSMLAAGHTHREGTRKQSVRRGFKWLKKRQDAAGCFGGKTPVNHAEEHAVAALAMVEIYGMTRSGLWKESAQKGVDFALGIRRPGGGWGHGESGADARRLTVLMIMVLRSAKWSGLNVDDDALVDAASTFEAPLGADGILARIFAGEDPRRSPQIEAAARRIAERELPVYQEGKIDLWHWYLGSLAMFQVGGSSWSAWNKAMTEAIRDHFRRDGNFAGSFDPRGAAAEAGGRVFSTALTTLTTEVHYRYPRLFGSRKR